MEPIKVHMSPEPGRFQGQASSGVAQVLLNWTRHLPQFGIEFVEHQEQADITIGHITANVDADIHVSHGLLWTEEFNLGAYAYKVNSELVTAAMNAERIITPSQWVADVYRRDLHASVSVTGHGVNLEEWQHDYDHEGYVLWAKNRTSDGLMPDAVNALARRHPNTKFITTFIDEDAPPNVENLGGAIPFNAMKSKIKRAAVVFMPDRETWGITAAEAMAAGVPVLSTDAGAVKEFMPHGVAGYCFAHMNLADAAQGLAYCLDHRDILSKNAQNLASDLSWYNAARRVADVIKEVYWMRSVDTISPTPLVDAVITAHNFDSVVGQAIQSVLDQRLQVGNVYVIDDSSRDDTELEIKMRAEEDPRVKYIRVEHENVALSRNEGIYASSAEFILILDADDRVRPDFLFDCLKPLVADKSVGFAYTSAEVHLDDGRVLYPPQLKEVFPPEIPDRMYHKDWPTTVFDKQFTPGFANQIPSGSIIRREALLRMGGYRARYAPTGAGTEDAELYLRLLAHGWRGVMVEPTASNLWIHTHGSGHVSGDKDFKEVDWRSWHPWTRDYRFPFAAVATPKKLSHPVRSYEPEVSVIIPVAPAHEKSLILSLDSLESQHYRKWEVIVVWDYRPEIGVESYFEKAYPFVRFLYPHEDIDAPLGAGGCRNRGVQIAQANYITFLDADDYYSPNFLSMVNPEASQRHNAVIYSQYYSRMLKQQHPVLGGNIVQEEGDIVIVDNSFRKYDKAKALAKPEGDKPYVWTGINVLLPKAWHDSIGGFDERMRSWEDCDYLLRLAWKGYDFHMIEKELWVYNFSSGSRRQDALGGERILMNHMRESYDEYYNV